MTNEEVKTEEIEEVFDGESIVPGLSQSEIEAIRKKALEEAKMTRHTFRQKGQWLVCRSCANTHASWIGMGVSMVGEKSDGTPILKKLTR